jgi:hypothetical protein
VNWTYLAVYKSSHAAIKSRWEGYLAHEPAWGRMESPEKLGSAMDSVLEGLWALLHSSNMTHLVGKTPPVDLPPWSIGACRLDSTLAFLAAGKRALQVVVHRADATQADLPREERSEQWAELMLSFDVVSQQEIQRVCGACFRREKCALGDTLKLPGWHEGPEAPHLHRH